MTAAQTRAHSSDRDSGQRSSAFGSRQRRNRYRRRSGLYGDEHRRSGSNDKGCGRRPVQRIEISHGGSRLIKPTSCNPVGILRTSFALSDAPRTLLGDSSKDIGGASPTGSFGEARRSRRCRCGCQRSGVDQCRRECAGRIASGLAWRYTASFDVCERADDW